MVSFNEHQFARLKQAAIQIDPASVQTILRLRALLRSSEVSDRGEFQKLFTNFYRLNIGGLTEALKVRFFELLFAFDSKQTEPYAPLLRELYTYKRRQGNNALHCSFVSKLVATQDESRPIYDAHVQRFFGISAPQSGSVDFRIAGFVSNLNMLCASYLAWVDDPCFQDLLALTVKNIPDANKIHPVRFCDLLVWTVGTQNIQ